MFRINYTNLTFDQVSAIVDSKSAPFSAGGYCDRLVGRKFRIVLDDEGITPPALEYEFIDENRLLLRENGAAAVECGYGARSMREPENGITLFSHMVPGTLRGYTGVLNFETGVATVVEMWFIDHQGAAVDSTKKNYSIQEATQLGFYVNREVERQIYRGYFALEGKAVPAGRDFRSLRLDNKMVYWKDTRGKECVITYLTNEFSSFIELNTPDGEDVITVPSDYLQMSDNLFLTVRGEVEYSGRLIIEVLDLFTMKKMGVTMGIDESDAFEYWLYKAEGRQLGQYAVFYDFNDKGDRRPSMIEERLRSGKGARCTYRTSILAKYINEEEVREAARHVLLFQEGQDNLMISENRMADSKQCLGKTMKVRDDSGYEIELDFFSEKYLRFRQPGTDWKEEQYRVSQLDEDLVYLGFYVTGSCPPRCLMIAIDFSNGCATSIDSVMAGGYDYHDVVPAYHFGYVEMEGITPPRTRRHHFTRELLGRSFTWTYSQGMSSQHIYNAPESYSWTIFTNGQPGEPANRSGSFAWSSPCTYIKLRDDVYIMTWIEEKWAGTMGSVAMNLRLMHDCGYIIHAAHDGSNVAFDQMSALARDAGKCDMTGIFGLKHLG